MMRPLYVFVSLIYLSSFFHSVSCAGSSPTLVNPADRMIPRTQDFRECSEPMSCDGLYYCGNGAPCYLRTCRGCWAPRGVYFPDYTFVPSCVASKNVTVTAAIITQESPRDVMRSTADACKLSKQMLIYKSVRSSKNVVDIINTISPDMSWMARYYTAYEIELFFFYEADPDTPVDDAVYIFYDRLRADSSSFFDETASTTSLDNRPASILGNTSYFQITPSTLAIQRCADGTAVAGSEKCPPIDPALVPNANAADSSTKTTTQLLTIILPIVGGVVFCALIIAALVIVRRRQANKVMRQTIQHTEPAVQVTMA